PGPSRRGTDAPAGGRALAAWRRSVHRLKPPSPIRTVPSALDLHQILLSKGELVGLGVPAQAPGAITTGRELPPAGRGGLTLPRRLILVMKLWFNPSITPGPEGIKDSCPLFHRDRRRFRAEESPPPEGIPTACAPAQNPSGARRGGVTASGGRNRPGHCRDRPFCHPLVRSAHGGLHRLGLLLPAPRWDEAGLRGGFPVQCRGAGGGRRHRRGPAGLRRDELGKLRRLAPLHPESGPGGLVFSRGDGRRWAGAGPLP